MGLAFLITTDNLQLLSHRKVLKESEYAALLDASQLVAVAQEEARRLAQQAEADAVERTQQGYEEGLEQAKSAYAQRLVSEAMAAQRQLQALRESMASIVVKAVGQFIADAPPEAQFEAALRRVDTLIRHEPFITLRVAAGSEGAVSQALARLREHAPWVDNVSVQTDASLTDGACSVHTASGTLEIGLEAQLDAFHKAVSGMALAAPGARA